MSRIIFINRYFHPDLSATSQMLSDLAFHLAKEGRDVIVVTSRQRYDDARASLPPCEDILGVDVVRIATTRFGRALLLGRALDYLTFYASAFWRLLWLLRKGDIAVAKTDPPLISVIVAAVVRLHSARHINWLQDIFPEVGVALGVRFLDGPVGRLAQYPRNWSLLRAEVNVVLGTRMHERVIALGVPADHVVTIQNWADDKTIVPLPHDRNPLREAWKLEDKFVVAYSGNMGRSHEFGAILGAARILNGHSQIAFVFVGGGAQLDGVRRYVADNGLVNVQVRPYQPRDQLAFSLGAADVHLVTLKPDLEGLMVPSKFYGIAAAARPVVFVGDPDGEIARLLKRYDCGHCFPIDGDVGLAALILALSERPAECIRLGRNARRALEDEWSQAKALERWDRLLS